MSSQSPKSGSPTKPDTQDSSEISSKLRGEIEKLKVSFESKNFQTLLLLLQELKAKHINSKHKIRYFRDLKGFKLLLSILIHYSDDYVTQSHLEHSQLISLVIGIMGNCCIQSNSVISYVSSILSHKQLFMHFIADSV